MNPSRKIAIISIAASAMLLLAMPQFLKNYGVYLLTYWLVFVIATMGLNLTVGFAGQKSLGHAAFFGIGAYTVAIMMKAGMSWWVGLPAAAALCFAVGLVLGFPALRVQTIYLAFATLGFNTAVWLVMRNKGADPQLKSHDGKTALSIAREGGFTSIVSLLAPENDAPVMPKSIEKREIQRKK